MPIDFPSLQLDPVQQLDFTKGFQISAERDRLKLMREQFEAQKAKQQRDDQMARLAEGGRMARAQMVGERQKQGQQAAAEAARLKEKQGAYQKFSELNGQGDVEGARAMVPFMTSLGMSVDLEGEEGGLPRYRIEMDPEAPAPDIDPAQAPGIGTTEEAFSRAQAATRQFEETGQPARPADVPDNVIDMQAMQRQTLARLDPALQAFTGAHPEGAHRGAAEKVAGGVRGLGLPAGKSLEMAEKLLGGPRADINQMIDAEAQAGRFEQTQTVAKGNEAVDRQDLGFTKIGKATGAIYGADDLLTGREQTANAKQILENDVDSDDELVLALISRRMGERGATTEGDIKRVTGMSALAWIDQMKSFFEKGLEGGIPPDQKDALLGVLKEMERSDNQRFATIYTKLEEEAAHPDTDPEVAKGIRAYARIAVPMDIRRQLQAQKKEKAASGTTAQADPNFDAALTEQAEAAGLDPEKIKRVIRKEGGAGGAVNPKSGATGLIQFLNDDIAKSVGSTMEQIRGMSDTEQIPLVVKYLSDRGVKGDSSADDYYMAVAAPAFVGKPDSSVVYAKGSKEWEQNPAWRPANGGDITVGDIKRYGGTSKSEGKSGADRMRELLKKGGY